ncbi:MAG: 3,4-dihydroxy-2-butanone-4-phosphate synthase [Myxococcota bacterium]
MHFHPIPELIEELRAGRMIILVDDEDRENEGDFVVAAEALTVAQVVQMNRLASGIITVPMPAGWLERLHIEPMVKDNVESLKTAFTVTVDARAGISTGSSAHDRVHTIRRLADPNATRDDFVRPGHINPLAVRAGGVLKRAGHTEASHDLLVMAGMQPVAVLCEIMGDDGEMLRLDGLRTLADQMGLKLGSIADIIRYRLNRENLITQIEEQEIETAHGTFLARRFRSHVDQGQYTVFIRGEVDPDTPSLVRIHRSSVTDDLFGLLGGGNSSMSLAFKRIAEEGGVLLYIEGAPTAASSPMPMDARNYGIGAQVLRTLGIRHLRLLTDNPTRRAALDGFGLEIVEYVPLHQTPAAQGE